MSKQTSYGTPTPFEVREKVLEAIGNGPTPFFLIQNRVCFDAQGVEVISWRAVDRALQVLRKNGHIKFDHNKGWSRV